MANHAKKFKITQRYRDEYSKEWPCLKKSEVSNSHVFCTVCCCDFSIGHGGRDDCRRHIESKKHEERWKLKGLMKPLDNFFQKNGENEVTNAEMLFTSFVVEHNLPIASADHAGSLFRAMFPDSKIAKKYGCARTKTSILIQKMAQTTQQDLISVLQKNPFSLATDGSTDSNNVKLYPVVVSFYSAVQGQVNTTLFSLLESTENTGEGIFNILNEEFIKKGIPWGNCLSFACDNANTMIGQFKGVAAFLKQVQPKIIIQGCSCHLIHLAAKKATASVKQINVEEFLIQLYYYLDKSSKRKNNYKLCQAVCGLKSHKILKYVSTRWLSLLDAVNRVLEQWQALVQFFCVENENLNLKSLIENPLTKLYCLFLSNVLEVFTSVNVFLQQEAPVIHLLHRKLMSLFMDLIVRFVKPSAVSENLVSVLDIDFKKKKFQKNDCDIVIGAQARLCIKENEFTDTQLTSFYSDVRNFYIGACEYMLKKFPLKSQMLKHAEVADISLRKKVSYASVEFILSLFPNLLTSEEVNKLDAEFAKYQYENVDESSFSRMDVGWSKISEIIGSSGTPKYVALPKLMLAVLLIPHSNAPTERVFSLVRKNSTEFRPSMSTSTLSALLIEKTRQFSNAEVCYKKIFSEQLLNSAKQATRQSLLSRTED